MNLLLTIDAGNTNTVLGIHEGAELRRHPKEGCRQNTPPQGTHIHEAMMDSR